MRKEDVFLVYKMLLQIRDLSEKLEDSLKKQDFIKISQLKQKILEMQRSLAKIL